MHGKAEIWIENQLKHIQNFASQRQVSFHLTFKKSFSFYVLNEKTVLTSSGMLAVATDDFTVMIIDSDVKKLVRKFNGHSNQISDMVWLSKAYFQNLN